MRAYGYGFPRMSTLGSSVNRADGRGWGRPPMEGATGPWDGCCLKPGPSLSTRATPPRRRYLRSPRSLAPLVAGPMQGVADQGLAVSSKFVSRVGETQTIPPLRKRAYPTSAQDIPTQDIPTSDPTNLAISGPSTNAAGG